MTIETFPLFQESFSQLKSGYLIFSGMSRSTQVFFERYKTSCTSTYRDGTIPYTPTRLLERDLQMGFETGKTPHNHLYLDDEQWARQFLRKDLSETFALHLECLFLSTWSPGEHITSRQFRDKHGISDLRCYCLLLRPSHKNTGTYERCGLLRLDLPWPADCATGSTNGDLGQIQRFFR